MNAAELPNFLKTILNEIVAKEGIFDYTIEVNAGCKKGDGMLSELLSVSICDKNVESSNKKLHLLCKLEPANIDRQRDFMTDLCFKREVNFYNKIVPILMSFQQGKLLNEIDQFNAFAKCYTAFKDQENDRYAIIMNDLRPSGFTMWDKLKPTTIQNIRLVMRTLGKFHGISFALKHQQPELFAQFQCFENVPKQFLESGQLQELMNPSYERAISVLHNVQHKEIMRKVIQKMPSLFELCLGKEASNRFGVISHGDFWNNNILYRFNENVCILTMNKKFLFIYLYVMCFFSYF